MLNLLKSLSLAALLVLSGRAAQVITVTEPNIPSYLEDISVTVTTAQGSGSGVIFSRLDTNGDIVNFVWTAGHVITASRTEREIVAPDGSKRTVVEFEDVHVVKELQEDGRIVGRLEMDARVIKYSDPEDGEDLALLVLRKHNFIHYSARFYLDKEMPAIGSELYHVGSLHGEVGANSFTTGVVSQTGRIISKHIFDQTTVTAVPGSSGGGVFLHDGRYIGMLVRGAGPTFNFIVPVRRMVEFAHRAKLEWALDPVVALPSVEAIEALPIEDNPSFPEAHKEAIKALKP